MKSLPELIVVQQTAALSRIKRRARAWSNGHPPRAPSYGPPSHEHGTWTWSTVHPETQSNRDLSTSTHHKSQTPNPRSKMRENFDDQTSNLSQSTPHPSSVVSFGSETPHPGPLGAQQRPPVLGCRPHSPLHHPAKNPGPRMTR
jgi:hypothetical protein